MNAYVYIQSCSGPDRLYTVGFYDPTGDWQAESDHETTEQAADRVHWLNGGDNENYQLVARSLADKRILTDKKYRIYAHEYARQELGLK